MTRRTDRTAPPTEKALQWQDMPTAAHRDVNAQMRNLGMAASGVGTQRTRLEAVQARPGSKTTTIAKAGQRLLSLAALEPHLADRPITHSGAAAARVGLVQRGGARALREGTDPGHNWYFQHHAKLAQVADYTGHERSKVIAASAVMSPQNNPEQELTAVAALSRAHHAKASMTIGHEAARQDPSLADWAGRTIHPSALTSAQLAGASAVGVREHITGNVDLAAIAKGGVKGNVTKAVDVLRGHIAPHEAINPRTSPKVWSYHENIAKAKPATSEQVEFHRRMGLAAGTTNTRQQQFDLYPELRGATHGVLSPTGATAEDTWQQAISTRQRLRSVQIPGRSGRASQQSPAKFSVGEGGQANQKFLTTPAGMTGVGPSATMHAWQNRATQLAAGRLSRRTGEIIPTMGVQAGGWTEARREAGKAIEENIPQRQRGPQPIQESLF